MTSWQGFCIERAKYIVLISVEIGGMGSKTVPNCVRSIMDDPLEAMFFKTYWIVCGLILTKIASLEVFFYFLNLVKFKLNYNHNRTISPILLSNEVNTDSPWF